MKVRILQAIAGNAEPLYDLPEFSFAFGDVVELDDTLASAWIASGIAEEPLVKTPTKISAKADAAAKAAKAKEEADAAAASEAAAAAKIAEESQTSTPVAPAPVQEGE